MRLLVSAVLILCVVGLSGCNTIRGVGKDIAATGEAIEKAANR